MDLPTKRFQRHVEDFTCDNCGTRVHGKGYTDHCPNCLTGKHVDINPGDRKSECKGMMKPMSADYKGGTFTINYQCENCGIKKRFKAAADDNMDLLIELTSRKGTS